MIKPRWQVEQYLRFLEEVRPRRIFELGIYDGGSTAFLVQIARPDKIVAIDVNERRCAALDEFVASRQLETVVATHYGVDQADAERIIEIADHEFGSEPLDLVIDDASHLVDETRTSFGVLFPRLRPGGWYVIEDWSWAHNDFYGWVPRLKSRAPLSIVLFELMLAAAHHPDVIEEIVARNGWAAVRRGPAAMAAGPLDLTTSYGEAGEVLVRGMSEPWSRRD